jgi:hypothetical protein
MRPLLGAIFWLGCNVAQPEVPHPDGGAPLSPLLTPAQQRSHELDKNVPMERLPSDHKGPPLR